MVGHMKNMVIVSVDDHIVEPPTMFDQHIDKAHRELMPEYIVDDHGNAFWWWGSENKRSANTGLNAVVGRPREEYGMEPMNTDQMRRGAWDPKAHIDDMNVAGVLMSVTRQFRTEARRARWQQRPAADRPSGDAPHQASSPCANPRAWPAASPPRHPAA